MNDPLGEWCCTSINYTVTPAYIFPSAGNVYNILMSKFLWHLLLFDFVGIRHLSDFLLHYGFYHFDLRSLVSWLVKKLFALTKPALRKSVQIRSIFWYIFSCIRTEYMKNGPEKTPYLDTFHAVQHNTSEVRV